MNLFVPAEIWYDGQIYPEEGASDRLDLGLESSIDVSVEFQVY
jgi:hypothetical protein